MIFIDVRKQIIVLLCVISMKVTNCQDEWFGPNKQYKCHCDTSCDTEGKCINKGKCKQGWFGIKCQYQDLLTIDGTTTLTEIDQLKDRDDSTCLNSNADVVINFNRTFVFTWLRIVVNSEVALSSFDVQFTKDENQPTTECNQKRLHQIGQITLDVKCNLADEIKRIKLSGTGIKYLCSLYINGGRNVALRQETSQKNTYDYTGYYYNSSKAVDGDTRADFSKLSCTHTLADDKTPWWKVKFIPSQITRYVLYNRQDYQERLRGFTLKADNSGNDVFTYQDSSTSDTSVYTIIDPKNRIITDVVITNNQILTLCEVEIYGECPTGKTNLSCESCPTTCKETCHTEDGACNTVCLGYDNPPGCTNVCAKVLYGINCKHKCPDNCNSSGCQPTNGNCHFCKPGYQGPTCSEKCDSYHWGQNCRESCSPNCYNKTCNHIDGSCIGGCGVAGFQLPNCVQNCQGGNWGINCYNSCSSHCNDQKQCNKTDGHCFGGCTAGFRLPNCVQDFSDCPHEQWGINCNLTCNYNCRDRQCDKNNGRCINGCISGFQPPDCNKDCVKGNYGINCEQTCPSYCLENECNPISGFCKNGSTADTQSVHKEENSSCTYFGAGFGAGIGSAAVLFAIVLLLLYWWYKKKILIQHKQSERQHTYNQPDSLQLEKHVYETAATEEVHYNII